MCSAGEELGSGSRGFGNSSRQEQSLKCDQAKVAINLQSDLIFFLQVDVIGGVPWEVVTLTTLGR